MNILKNIQFGQLSDNMQDYWIRSLDQKSSSYIRPLCIHGSAALSVTALRLVDATYDFFQTGNQVFSAAYQGIRKPLEGETRLERIQSRIQNSGDYFTKGVLALANMPHDLFSNLLNPRLNDTRIRLSELKDENARLELECSMKGNEMQELINKKQTCNQSSQSLNKTPNKVKALKSRSINFDFKVSEDAEHVIKELINTEKNFCAYMMYLTKTAFLNKSTVFKALQNVQAIDSREFQVLSSGWNEVISSSKKVLHSLNKLENKSLQEKTMHILNLFRSKKMQTHLKNIKNMSDKYSFMNVIRQKALKHQKGANLIKKFEQINKRDFDFCMVAPVQRVPRYGSLLNELKRTMQVDKAQKESVEKVFKEITDYFIAFSNQPPKKPNIFARVLAKILS